MKKLVIFFAVFSIVLTSKARMGETLEQCEARYGKPISEIIGGAGVYTIRTYQKEDIQITAFFMGNSTQNAQVRMLVYEMVVKGFGKQPLQYEMLTQHSLSPEEEKQLLSAIPGLWEVDDARTTLKSTRKIDKPLIKSFYERRLDACKAAVKDAITAVHKTGLEVPVNDLLHNNKEIFAFRVPGGMAVINQEAAPNIQRWAEVPLKHMENERNAPARTLDGF